MNSTDLGAFLPPEIGGVAVAALAVLLILSGRIVPRSVLEDVRRDRDARLQEAAAQCDARVQELTAQSEQWRLAYLATDARADVLAQQVDELVRQGRTASAVLTSLARVAGGSVTDGR